MKKNVQRLLTISILTSMTGAGIFAINKLINALITRLNVPVLHCYFYMIFPLQVALSNGNFSKSSSQKITQYTAWICWAVDVLIVRKSLIQTFFMFS